MPVFTLPAAQDTRLFNARPQDPILDKLLLGSCYTSPMLRTPGDGVHA